MNVRPMAITAPSRAPSTSAARASVAIFGDDGEVGTVAREVTVPALDTSASATDSEVREFVTAWSSALAAWSWALSAVMLGLLLIVATASWASRSLMVVSISLFLRSSTCCWARLPLT